MTETPERPHPLARRPSEEQWTTGPAVGDPLPDFTLPDQRGHPTGLHATRGDGRVLLTFLRSVVG